MPKSITKKYFDTQFDKLGQMMARGFDETSSKTDLKMVENRLTGVEGEMLKVNDRLTLVERKLDETLYKEVDRIEGRVKRLEQKTGIK